MLIFFFSTMLWASQQIEKFCLASTEEAFKAQKQIEFILIKNQDKTLLEDKCLTLAVADARVELVKRWMRAHYPHVQLSFSSSEPSQNECRLKFKKLKKAQLANQGVEISQQRVNIQSGSQLEEAQDIRLIRTLEGKKSVLELDRFRLTFTCRYHNSSSYTLELRGESIPLPPRITTTQTPFGVTTTQQNEAESLEALETTLSLRKNEEINIGQIFKNLDSKNKDLNLNNPNLNSQEGSSLSQWFVSLY